MIRQAPSAVTLRDFLHGDYTREHLGIDPKTIEQMEIAISLFEQWLGHSPTLDDLSRDAMLDWMRWLLNGRSPSTVNSKRTSILALWNFAADEMGYCSPPGKIKKLKVPKKLPIVWTLEQIDQIFAACDRLHGSWEGVPVALAWKIGILLAWDTGNRLTAILKAEMKDLSLQTKTLFVPAGNTKGKIQDRIYHLHDQTIAAIQASLPSDRTRIFPFPFCTKQVWYHLKKILRSAGLPDDRSRMFHCFRRSAESYAAKEKGVQWAADAIGHSAEVAKRSYVSPIIAPGPSLIDALPRPNVKVRRKGCPQQLYLRGFN